MLRRDTALIASVVETHLNKKVNGYGTNINRITQSRLWKGKHRHYDYEDNITMVLIIPYIASPPNLL